MPPLYSVQAGEINKYRSQQKDRFRKINRKMENIVEDKAHHDTLERVHIQRMSIHTVGSSRALHTALECVCIKH